MSSASTQTQWPYPGFKRAWSPGSPEQAIPLKPNDVTVDRETYLARMQDRLQWMIDKEGGQEAVYPQVAQAMAEEGLPLGTLGPQGPLAPSLAQDPNLQFPPAEAFPVKVAVDQSLIPLMQEARLADWISQIAPVQGNSLA